MRIVRGGFAVLVLAPGDVGAEVLVLLEACLRVFFVVPADGGEGVRVVTVSDALDGVNLEEVFGIGRREGIEVVSLDLWVLPGVLAPQAPSAHDLLGCTCIREALDVGEDAGNRARIGDFRNDGVTAKKDDKDPSERHDRISPQRSGSFQTKEAEQHANRGSSHRGGALTKILMLACLIAVLLISSEQDLLSQSFRAWC